MAWLTLAITLLLVMDPLGNVPILTSLLEKTPADRRRRVIFRECVIALGILLLFLVAGPQFMSVLGLKQPSLSLAGGVVLMLIALRMLFPSKGGIMGEDEHEGEPFIVPIAMPLIAGPSAIASVILLHGASDQWFIDGTIAIAIAWSITTAVLLFAPDLIRLLGKRLLIAGERLTGMLLAVIAVQMILGGVESFIKNL